MVKHRDIHGGRGQALLRHVIAEVTLGDEHERGKERRGTMEQVYMMT